MTFSSDRAMSPSHEQGRLDSLTGMRFFAALYVVLYHLYIFLFPELRDLFGFGYTGVAFFYCLSGFVLTWSHRSDDSARRFYRRRFARIYPLHLVTTICAIVLGLWTDGTAPLPQLIAVLLLLQAWVPLGTWRYAFNGSSWSLSCEAFFYAIFPSFVGRISRASTKTLVGVGAASIVTAVLLLAGIMSVLPQQTWSALTYTNPAFRVFEFVLGMIGAALMKRGSRLQIRPSSSAIVLAGGVASAYLASALHIAPVLDSPYYAVGDLFVLPGIVLVVIALAQADVAGVRLWTRSPFLRVLGEWSFALYLCHELLIRAVRYATPEASSNRLWAAILVVPLSIALAGALHHFIERPLEKRLRGRVRSPRPAEPAGAVHVSTAAQQNA